ncbi:malto-oligosyltrehalose synthase [Nocardioides taihuensis]|uniref:Malto-oligosyltrehalose synthase n=1 Tax=Nocardioides taihuensis TaxID=1835606 RepID=A0ABW0BKT1_9ACTN
MRVPTSTYRVQVTAEQDLFAVARLLPYLHELGVDWVYLSPILEAEPGSDHGYDVVAHDRVDAARGGAAGLAAVSEEARRLGMGVVVDIVPNHVGVAVPEHNAWWWDLLAHGPESAYAEAFDVDWEAGDGKVRLPVLGDGGLDDLAIALPDSPYVEPVHWRVADHGLNWRRFFAINTLAGVRVEEPRVFEATHVEVRRWFDEGLVDGLRIDHPDGLRDPRGYLDDLAALTGGAWVVVEKILEPGEELPASWATAGTTGYDALASIDRVLTDSEGVARLPHADVDWHALVHDLKRAAADGVLGSEVRRVVRELPLDANDDGDELVDAVAELLACFPVYRSYLPEGREHLDAAFTAARASRPDLAASYDLIEPVLADPEQPAALRFQQTSGAVMAKGVEDAAFYRYPRLTSLTEVGGDPSVGSVSVGGFHEAMAVRQATHPHAMTTLTTHDTKRSEDVRARITVLAELPAVWAATLAELQSLAPLPDAGFADLLWQAAVGAWPLSRERLHTYAEKAMREAGDRTTWTDPDEAYEAAVHAAVDAAYDDARVRGVLETAVERAAGPGWVNALSAKLLSITVPGVPDVYQGSELWEQSLVDPDNRRPVEFALRGLMLVADDRSPLSSGTDDPGAAKLRVVSSSLRLRRDRPELFTSYAPVDARGHAADHVLAFDRGGAITVATRLPVGLASRGGWGDTELDLPPGDWHDVVADRPASARVGDLLDGYPVALLVRRDA